nr:LRR receptor-like serine/threonine-protein kinase ERL1 [Ipomoea batatas]
MVLPQRPRSVIRNDKLLPLFTASRKNQYHYGRSPGQVSELEGPSWKKSFSSIEQKGKKPEEMREKSHRKGADVLVSGADVRVSRTDRAQSGEYAVHTPTGGSFADVAILDPVDFLALQVVQKSLDDLPGSNYFGSWDFTSNPCGFAGVFCDGDNVCCSEEDSRCIAGKLVGVAELRFLGINRNFLSGEIQSALDLIGRVVSIIEQKVVQVNSNPQRLIDFVIEDSRGSRLTVTLWEDHVDSVLPYYNVDLAEPLIVILQLCRAWVNKGK